MKIYVAGHSGLVGSAIVRAIERQSKHTFVGESRERLDLSDSKSTIEFFQNEKPDAVIVAAARVGGIMANLKSPVEFLADNLSIELNVLKAAHEVGTQRLLFLGSSCIYPKFSSQPIKEEYLLSGALEETNEPYALAKIVGVKLTNAYRRQYGHDWISAMPCNIFGIGDNFDLETGHVLPALIRKFDDAKRESKDHVVLWGSGAPLREFLNADELAEACLFMLENYHSEGHINIGSGNEVSIRELAHLVADIVGYEGEIRWDHSKPDGTPRKVLDTTKLRRLGWAPRQSLRDGIASTYSWYLKNYPK